MLIALAFAHCSSELLLKEQIIIPVKKTLNNAGHIDAKLIDFSEICQKKSSEIGCFLLVVSWRSFPPKFPVKSADFSANLPLKIPQNFAFFPAKYQKPCLIWQGISGTNNARVMKFTHNDNLRTKKPHTQFWLATPNDDVTVTSYSDFSMFLIIFPLRYVKYQ